MLWRHKIKTTTKSRTISTLRLIWPILVSLYKMLIFMWGYTSPIQNYLYSNYELNNKKYTLQIKINKTINPPVSYLTEFYLTVSGGRVLVAGTLSKTFVDFFCCDTPAIVITKIKITSNTNLVNLFLDFIDSYPFAK